LKEKFKI